MDDSVEAKAVVVLPRVGSLIPHRFEQVINSSRDYCPQNRPDKKDPDFGDVIIVDNSWTQSSGWVYRGSGIVDAFMMRVRPGYLLVRPSRSRDLPIRCATNNAKPMANGAMNEVRLFSTASMMIVMTSSAVRITSRNKPCTGSVPDEREFSAWSFPGSNAETTPAAVIAPRN